MSGAATIVEGRFGPFGGRYVPEVLIPALEELSGAWARLRADRPFRGELASLLRDFVGRPTPLTFASRLSAETGYRVWLKREDLAHTGAHLPDLPVDEAAEWLRAGERIGVSTVLLAAPGTSAERLRMIGEHSKGFVYCVSTHGVTGERASLSETSEPLIRELRPLTSLPLVLGVGIGSPEQAREACRFADGVVVGTALVRPLLEEDREGCLELAQQFRRATLSVSGGG